MSHAVSHAMAEFTDLKTLTRAFESFGWEVLKTSEMIITTARNPRGLYAVDNEYVAINPGDCYNSYDVGINSGVIDAHGRHILDIIYNDDYRSVSAVFGNDLSKLKQAYSKASIEMFAESKGATVEFITLEDGTLDFVLDMQEITL